MLIHFIRHTTPDIKAGICYGQADIGLADSFSQETNKIIQRLSLQGNAAQYDKIISSPAKRCYQLAEKIQRIQTLDTPILTEDALQEVDFGDWELRPWAEIPRKQSQAWADDFVHNSPPKGESLAEMQQRVQYYLHSLFEETHEHIAVVTHAGVIRLVVAEYLNIPLNSIFNLQLDYGQVVELTQKKNHYNLRFIC